ncbi:hypothetical protein [Streptomyces sp. NPDC059080]|uniref:hypothetical protein n=1 Tax=Streptomyces sp. NPDC059080 TaxID=3346718 RepID=UPI0036CA699B
MAANTRFHTGGLKSDGRGLFTAECHPTLDAALDWLIQDAGLAVVYYAEEHRLECGVSASNGEACDCVPYKAHLQALELAERCLQGDAIPSFMVGGEEYWARPVEGCECDCDGLCECRHWDELNAAASQTESP